ncbi:MAG: hypothetical protein WA691_04060 [Thermoplasmata archaeon]
MAEAYRAVYFDEEHDSSWIDKETWGKGITRYLADREYERVDASGLAGWLLDRKKGSTATRSVLAFSQDLVPFELCPDASANNPVREYLDAGGRIVWIGDIPFWSKSVGRGRPHEQIWMYGAHHANLGVQPLFSDSSSRVTWVAGPGEGLKSSWYSQRPVAVEIGATSRSSGRKSVPPPPEWSDQGLAFTPLATAQVTLHPEAWNGLVIARWKMTGKRVGSLGLGNLGSSVKLDWSEPFPPELSLTPLGLAAAWHIAFRPETPRQGFYRFFDTGSFGSEPPVALLEDIVALAEWK